MEHLGPEMGFEAADLGGLDFPGETEHSSSTASSLLPSLPGVGTYSTSGPGGPETIFSGGSLDLQDYTTALSQNMTIGGLDQDLATLSKSDGSTHGGGLGSLYSHPQNIGGGNGDLVRHSACSGSGFGMSRMQTNSPEEHYHSTSISQTPLPLPTLATASQSPLVGIERVERLVSPTSFDVDAFLICSTQQAVGQTHTASPRTSMATIGPNGGLAHSTPGGFSFRPQGQIGKASMTSQVASQGLKIGSTLVEASREYLQRMHSSLLQGDTDVNSGISDASSPFISPADQQLRTNSDSPAIKPHYGNYALKVSSACSVDPFNVRQLDERLTLGQATSVLQSVSQDQGMSHLRIHQGELSTPSSQGIETSAMTFHIASNSTQPRHPKSDPLMHSVSHNISDSHKASQDYPSRTKSLPHVTKEQEFLGIGGFTSLVTSSSLTKIKGQQDRDATSSAEIALATQPTCSSSNSLLVKSETVQTSDQGEKISNPSSPSSEDNLEDDDTFSNDILQGKDSQSGEKETDQDREVIKGNPNSKYTVADIDIESPADIVDNANFSTLDAENKMDNTVVNELAMTCDEAGSSLDKQNTKNVAHNSVQGVGLPKSSGDELISVCGMKDQHDEMSNYSSTSQAIPNTGEAESKEQTSDQENEVGEDGTECEGEVEGDMNEISQVVEPESARGRWKRRWKGMQEKAIEKRNKEDVEEDEETVDEGMKRDIKEHDELQEDLSEEENELNQMEEEMEEMGDSYDQVQDQMQDSYDANAGLTALLTASKTAFMDRVEVNIHVDDSQCIVNQEGHKRWQCDECPKSYTTKHNLITHKLGHSGIKPHCCMLCGKFFKQMSHLQTHMLTHGGIKPHVCVICHRGFTQASHMKRHMATHMERRPYVCQICERGFAYPSELKAHMEKHKKSKDNTCEECGEKFETPKKMRQHLLMAHKNIAELTCKECGKVFTYPSQLRDHMVKHSGRRPYMCGECGMEFMKEHHLKAHQFTHTGLRPYICPICQRSFNQKANMQRHMLIHEDSKKFKCDICDRMFSQPQTLKAHQVTHSDKKPYHCEICGKEFGRLHNLQGHMHIHKDSKPHLCFCGSSFTLKGNLNRHKKVKHGLSVPAECTEEEAAQILNSMSTGKRQVEANDQEDSSATEDTPRKKRKSQPRKSVPTNSEEEEKDSDNEWESDRDISSSPSAKNILHHLHFRRQIQFDETSADLEYSTETVDVNEELDSSSITDRENKVVSLENFVIKSENNSVSDSTATEPNAVTSAVMIHSRKMTSLLDKKFKQSKALNNK